MSVRSSPNITDKEADEETSQTGFEPYRGAKILSGRPLRAGMTPAIK